MPTALRVCSQPGCPELTSGGRCDDHRREADHARGTPAQRGYSTRWHNGTRRAALLREPLCVCTEPSHPHGARQCLAQSTVADHWPESRRSLVARGVPDPDALHRLRGICTPCHGRWTASEQPGGWAAGH